MQDQLNRMECKLDKISEDVSSLREGRAENRTAIKGHATQIALLWTITLLTIGGVVAAYFKV